MKEKIIWVLVIILLLISSWQVFLLTKINQRKEVTDVASIKITQLNEDTELESNDVIPFVDVSADETKKITKDNLLKSNIEILNGTLTIEQGIDYNTAEAFISYPQGFNNTNCVILTGFIGSSIVPSTYIESSGNIIDVSNINLSENSIILQYKSKYEEVGRTVPYKIVLMKIS